jgi:isopentenyl-diphosphate delta-isomerase
MEEIILVDENDHELGGIEKMAAHRLGGQLHRAFSIFIFNTGRQLLLQQRAWTKYHFGGLWSNSCCGHPRKGEPLETAVHRRLREEFGFDTALKEIFTCTYRADDPQSGLSEHEVDHIFVGFFDGCPNPNPEEIAAFRWAQPSEIGADLASLPEQYTPWFAIILAKLVEKFIDIPRFGP